MKVIKLGGSLINDVDILTSCLDTIEQNSQGKVVIVPGGGVFADQVRRVQTQWQFNDLIAHEMAILAMQQTALLLKSIKPSFLLANRVSTIDNSAPVVIWSPDIAELNGAMVEASWDITSDSLAAWLATQLNADELILVKSAEIPPSLTLQQMQTQGLVDNAFSRCIKNALYKITLLNKNSFNEHAFA
jgi:aspartokinase-like uncharacterized kinase